MCGFPLARRHNAWPSLPHWLGYSSHSRVKHNVRRFRFLGWVRYSVNGLRTPRCRSIRRVVPSRAGCPIIFEVLPTAKPRGMQVAELTLRMS